MRLGGTVARGLSVTSPAALILYWREKGKTLPITYIAPIIAGTFVDKSQALVKAGQGQMEGCREVVQAKCASKYEAAPAELVGEGYSYRAKRDVAGTRISGG